MTARRSLSVLCGLLAIPVVAAWNRLQRARESGIDPDPGDAEPRITEHERGWRTYLRGFDAHHGPDGHPAARPADGSLWRGLRLWVGSSFLRGYTLGNDVYVCPSTPRIVRIHQAGHTPAFGDAFEPLADERREDGGLPDEPLSTMDVMLPGSFPHTFLRFRDPRGLGGAYRVWLQDGVVARVSE